jgi:hypothetical protein
MLGAAARIGMAFRGLFNQPVSQALLRGESDEFYWKSVLRHCVEYDLQSVLDEYALVLLESEGLAVADPANAVMSIAEAMDEALSLKPAQIEIKASGPSATGSWGSAMFETLKRIRVRAVCSRTRLTLQLLAPPIPKPLPAKTNRSMPRYRFYRSLPA